MVSERRTVDKYFISAEELLLDSFRLAEKVYLSGFRPQFVIGVWRGGTPIGIAVQEYLDYMGVVGDHIAIRTSSYTGIGQQSPDVKVYGMDYVIEHAKPEQELLIVDDVFDSGRSIRAIFSELRKLASVKMPRTIKVACPWYKPNNNVTELVPDFYLHETDQWLVFPHEIKGLDLEEIRASKGQTLAETLNHRQIQ